MAATWQSQEKARSAQYAAEHGIRRSSRNLGLFDGRLIPGNKKARFLRYHAKNRLLLFDGQWVRLAFENEALLVHLMLTNPIFGDSSAMNSAARFASSNVVNVRQSVG